MGLFSWGKKAPIQAEPDLIVRVERGIEQRKEADKAGYVQGKHYTEWVPTLNEWRKAGASKEEDYLKLVLQIIGAAEKAAAIIGQEPAPGYTERAAIVYRRRKDYAAEAAILRRYVDACPPGRGRHFAERIEKADELALKRAAP